MFGKRGLVLSLIVVLLICLSTAGYAQFTQLRYVKTTDFGATWTGPTQAGDVSSMWQTVSSLPDFSAIAMNNDELCYAVFIPGAPTPGVYAFAGPSFAPALIMEEGNNNFGGTGSGASGWTTVGKTLNGDIFVLIWGADAGGANTLWGAKSTNNGGNWTTFVVGAEPTSLPAGSADFHISDLNSANWCFVVFHVADGTQYVMRFPTSGGTGTYVNLNDVDGSSGAVSYYIGQCKPIAYDPTANALFTCHRNSDVSGTSVHYSSDMGLTFTTTTVVASQRYPSMALRMADQTPFVISNVGVPAVGARHWSWYSYDQGQYNAGLWTDPDTIGAVTYESPGPLLYINQAYFWDATHGVASQNLWGSYTPEGLYTSRTTNGTLWTDLNLRWEYQNNTFDPGSASQNEVVGAGNGIAYIIFCARVGAPDTDGPGFGDFQLLTPATNLPPYVLSAYVLDASGNNDISDIHITYWSPQHAGGAPDTLSSDSSTGLDGNNNGTFYFHIPTTIGGGNIVQGDTVWYYFWGRDLAGISGESLTQGIVAGVAWLAADEPRAATPAVFALYPNYPNPFNPETQIRFDLAAPSQVTLTVYNTLGQEVTRLADHRSMSAGTYSLTFNGADLPSGLYLCRLDAGTFSQTRKMVLVK